MRRGTRLSSREIKSVLKYYRGCIEQEDHLAQIFDVSKEGTLFYSTIIQDEELFHKNATTIDLQKSEQTNHCLHHLSTRQHKSMYYGYPIYKDKNGKITPVFLTEVTVQETGDTVQCTRKSDQTELNKGLLIQNGYEPEEIKKITSELEQEPDPLIKLEKIQELLSSTHHNHSPQLDQKNLSEHHPNQILNKAIIYFDEHTAITHGLLLELQKLITTKYTELKTTALSPLFGNRPPRTTHHPQTQKNLLEIYPMNPSQEHAVHNALTNPVTVITGPPGTGKSQVVLNIIANAVYHNKTVLFASKNNKAVDVVTEKLNTILSHPLLVRMGTKPHRKNAKNRIQNLLARTPFPLNPSRLKQNETELHRLTTTLNQINTQHSTQQNKTYQPSTTKKPYWTLRHTRTKKIQEQSIYSPKTMITPLTPEEQEQKKTELQKEKIKVSREIFEQDWLHKINTQTPTLQHHISRYLEVSERLEHYIKNPRIWTQLDITQKKELEKILPILPVWIVTNLSAKNSLPFTPAAFDIVIIDEASQCDIPSALPLLYRAKQVVIIGDPKQLRHISLLKETQENSLAASHKIKHLLLDYSYTKHSLYDLMERIIMIQGTQPLLLNEHYRSHRDIISFSNEYFYGGKLIIRTNEKNLIVTPDIPQGIIWVDVHGTTAPSKSPYCLEEVDQVITLLKQFKVHEKTQVSFGVVTLFRAQMEKILEKISSDEYLQNRGLTVGTAHKFQGDEKDVIIFSLAVSEGVRSSTLHWIENTQQLINVAITRAKSLVIIVGDKQICCQTQGLLNETIKYTERKNMQK
ncbi:MAG: AAA domain-containing protein [Methanobacteriota archaeon]